MFVEIILTERVLPYTTNIKSESTVSTTVLRDCWMQNRDDNRLLVQLPSQCQWNDVTSVIVETVYPSVTF